MTKNSKNVTVKDAARYFWGKTQFEYATNNKLEKVQSDICMLSESYATDGSFMIYGAGKLEFEPVKNSRYCDLPREQIKPVIMPYINASICAKVPAALFGHLAAGHSKKVFLAAAGRWCSFVANDVDHGMHIEDGADMGDFFNLGGIKATFDGSEVAKIFKKFKVDGVEICRPSKGSDFMRFYFTFKGAKFTAILLKCYRDDYNADYEDEAFKLVEKWDRDDVNRAQEEKNKAEIAAAVAKYPTAPVAACEAPKADDSDDNGAGDAPEYTIKPSTEYGGSEIYFNVKPSQEVRDTLKACGYRWHGVKKCWYGYTDEETARHMIEAAEGVEAIKAGNVKETAQEGENSRGGVDIPPETKTAPEAKETAKAEAVPDSVRNYGKAGAMLETLESQVCEGESLPEHWRRVWKACGLKGVTVSSRRGGYTSHYSFKFTMMPCDVLPFENCREALEVQARERLARGVWDDEKGGYIDYFHMTGDEQRAEETRQARKYWEKVKTEGSRFSICHYWQIDRNNSPEFSESFWRRWELVGRSVARFNYDHSDAMTDYFDVGFYEDWEIKPEGKVRYKPAEWYAIDNLYNLAKAIDEKAEAERKAKEEAEAKKEREEREAHYCDLDKKARESVATWSEAFPYASGVAPFVTVEWCEINAMHETGEEHAQEEGTPATRWSLDAFNMVTEDLDRYIKGCGWFGYFKLKYTVEFPDGYKYTDRIDLGDGVGGLVESARAIVKYNEDRKASGEEYGGTIYGGSVEEWRARLERLEAATDPDAVAMARGLLELGETA